VAHFAKIENGIVTNVIIADQAFIDSGHVEGTWLETTPNAYGGIVYDYTEPSEIITYRNGLPEGFAQIPTDKPCIRKNYGGIGYTYDSTRDAFIPPKPEGNWYLDDETCLWFPK
jgi:hypothetical protein